jgi:hypothetical protein
VIELPFNRSKTLADLTKRLRSAQLTEQHGHELLPASESSGVPFGLRLSHHLLELRAGKQLEYLTENAGECFHAGPPVGRRFSKN